MTELRQRHPRQLNPGYLAWIRQQGCACGCKSPPPSDAAHIRSASLKNEKPHTGLAEKPSDRWTLPLKHDHHMAQHAFGDEILWWSQHGIKDVFTLALSYNALYSKETGKDPKQHIEKRRATKRKTRKIAGRSTFPKGRKLQSRGFEKRQGG